MRNGDHDSLNEKRRELLRRLSALPEEGRRRARRMILVIFASFGVLFFSGIGMVIYVVRPGHDLLSLASIKATGDVGSLDSMEFGPTRSPLALQGAINVLAIWIGAMVLFALVGVTYVSIRFAKMLGLQLRSAPPPDPPPF